jgi:type III pantothenate kinase
MLLVLDIGNSQTSYGIFKKDKLLHHWRAETKISRTADEYAAFLFPLLDNAGLSKTDWEGIAICSVVPPVEENFEIFCETYLKRKPFKISSTIKLGFGLNVEVPQEVGADRLANCAYAIKHMKLPALVVDLGTATTFDVISTTPAFEGGIILPGVRMGAESLSRKTSLLPIVDVKFPPSVIGKNTITCIQSGVLFGYCDAIDGLLKRLLKELPGAEIALTGGVAPLFIENLSVKAKYLPNLTLEGTEILFRQNC